ncbi:hypothetical protein ACNKHM_23185 [Shigella sonnei]
MMLDEPQYWKKYYRTGFNDSLLDIGSAWGSYSLLLGRIAGLKIASKR